MVGIGAVRGIGVAEIPKKYQARIQELRGDSKKTKISELKLRLDCYLNFEALFCKIRGIAQELDIFIFSYQQL